MNYVATHKQVLLTESSGRSTTALRSRAVAASLKVVVMTQIVVKSMTSHSLRAVGVRQSSVLDQI